MMRDAVPLKLTVDAGENATIEAIDRLRRELYLDLAEESDGYSLEVHSPAPTQSSDPNIVGAVTLTLLPAAVDRLVDLIAHWSENKGEGSAVTVSIPVEDGSTVAVTYDPYATTPEAVKEKVQAAVEALPPL